jgi:predicted RNA binding protein YcfA (HicA-like mRNA interferase family)
MTYRELTRKLRRLGCEFDRQARGDHEIWINTANRQRTTIPNRGRRDLPLGTLHGILRDLGLTREELDRV